MHARVAAASTAWDHLLATRPVYALPSIERVAVAGGRIVGLLDLELEGKPGERTSRAERRGAMVHQFGRLPEAAGRGVGRLLIESTLAPLRAAGIDRVEFWSQDPDAQAYYAAYPMAEIHRYVRFAFRPDDALRERFLDDGIVLGHLRGMCPVGHLDDIRTRHRVVETPPLAPRLVVGFELEVP